MGRVFVMRVIVALVVVGALLSGCSCPPRTGHLQTVPARCLSAQSQPKLTKVAKVVKLSRPVSSKKFKTRLAKPAQPQIKAPASGEMGPPLPPRKPELAPANDADHRLLFRQGSLNKHPTLVNALYLKPSSWPQKPKHSAKEFNRLQAKTFEG